MAGKGVITGKEVLDGVSEAISQSNLELEKLLGNYKELIALIKSVKSIQQANGASGNANTTESKVNATIKERNRLLKEEERLLARIKTVVSGEADEVARRRNALNNYNKSKREEIQLESALSTELRKAQIIRNGFAKTVADLNLKKALGQKLSKKEIALLKSETIQFKKYDTAVRRAEQSVGRFQSSVGNYGKALGSLNKASSFFLASLGVYSAVQGVQSIFNQIKALESLDLALRKVTDSQEEFNQTQFFIKEIADFTGVALLDLTDAYKRFRGSIKGSNITVADAQRVFERTAKASAILGSTTDETNGVLRALGQIISKGKVQAEELRGQLGDRLSGAFGIMAKAIGVTTEELDQMIERGEVTSDTIVALSEQLGKEFGVDSVDKIDTVNAAVGRLETAYTSLIKAVQEGAGVAGQALKGFLGLLTISAEGFAFLFSSAKQVDDAFINKAGVKAYKEELERTEKIAKQLGETVEQVANRSLDDYTKSVETTKDEIEKLTKQQAELKQTYLDGEKFAAKDAFAIQQLTKQIRDQNATLSLKEGRLRALLFLTKELRAAEDAKANGPADGTIPFYEAQIKALKENQDSLNISEKTKIKFIADQIKYYQEQIEIIRGVQKETKKQEVIIENTIAFYEAQIKVNQKAQTEVSKTSEEYAKLQMEIDLARIKIEQIQGLFAGGGEPIVLIETPSTDLDDVTKSILKRIELEKKQAKAIADLEQQNRDSVKATFDSFAEYYNIDMDNFNALFDGKKNSLSDYADAAKGTLDFLLGNTLEKYDRELQANQNMLDAVLNNENASDEQKQIAKRKAEIEEKKIKSKAYKAEQQFLIAKIAIDTAAQVSKILGIAAAFTAAGLIPMATNAYVQAGIAGAVGAAQIAFVASRKPPEFFKGKTLQDTYEGMATWGEHRPEVLISGDGSMQVSPNKTTPLYVKRDDIIVPSIDQFHREVKNPDSDVFKRVSQKINSDTSERKQMVVVNNSPMDTKGIEEVLEKVMYKYSKRAINVNNTIKMPEQRTRKY